MTIAIGGGPTIAENIRHDPADGTRSKGSNARGNGTPTPISKRGLVGSDGSAVAARRRARGMVPLDRVDGAHTARVRATAALWHVRRAARYEVEGYFRRRFAFFMSFSTSRRCT
jgi:hypothetical protein